MRISFPTEMLQIYSENPKIHTTSFALCLPYRQCCLHDRFVLGLLRVDIRPFTSRQTALLDSDITPAAFHEILRL